MTDAGDIPAWAAVLVSVLIVVGAGLTFIGALGLIRLRESFYERVHAPTLGTTLGTGCVAFASMVYFSALGDRLIVHELLIIVFITVTTPISLIVVVRAAFLRDAFGSGKESAKALDRQPR